MDHELEILEQYIEEVRAKFSYRKQLRDQNSQENIIYPNDAALEKLDLSIKKNSALVKRLKVYTESQKVQILDEIERLNLTKFISEVAASLIEAKLKLSDIPSVIEICTKLNRSYKDFNRHLLDQYSKYFPALKRKTTTSASTTINFSTNSNNLVSLFNPSKVRVDLRLFAELIIYGVLPLKEGFPILLSLLYNLMIHDKNIHQNASAILTFCKGCGDELLGLAPRNIQYLAQKYNKELPTSDLINAKRQSSLKNHVRNYYLSMKSYLHEFHEELRLMIIKNNKICKNKGDTFSKSSEITAKRAELAKIHSTVNQLAELLDEEAPEISSCEQFQATDHEETFAIESNTENSPTFPLNSDISQIWDDEGTRAFYEDLLDLKTLFPNLSIKISRDKEAKPPGNTNARPDNETNNDTVGQIDAKPIESPDNDASCSSSSSTDSSDEEISSSNENPANTNQITMCKSVANRIQPEQYFVKLSNCVNRDMIDNAAIDFIRFFNTKFGRRKLVKTLFNVQRTRLDLLPFFARLTATIYPFVPRVGNELASQLKSDFNSLFRKKDQINIESKVKNVRFIGELVKFNLYPKPEVLLCFKMLLSDFTHHHIEMTCNLLETCGRLLFRSQDSHNQMRLILEQMMRKKMLLSVDNKYVTMIENAYYFTNPPEVIKRTLEEPPVHIYVRYLLCDCLNRSTIDKVVSKLRLLDWEDRRLAKFVINCMVEAYNLKFYNIRYLAALLSALNKDYPWIAIAVVDGVVEDILLMMEINEKQFNQRRIPMIRYFGELYNYRLSDSSVIFKILYSLITYGVQYPDSNQGLSQMPMSNLDPPDNLFRIKLVCDLLETCGHHLGSGQETKKLDCYLLFFQRYYWLKRHVYMLNPYCMAKGGNQFPASTDHLYDDTITRLRPSFKRATSYLESVQILQEFINNLAAE